MNITIDKKDAVLAAAIDAERYPVCHMRYDALKPFDIPYPETMHVLRELAQMGYISKTEPYGEEVHFKANSGLNSFFERGGFRAQELFLEANLTKICHEADKLVSELPPSFTERIKPILELANSAATIIQGINTVLGK